MLVSVDLLILSSSTCIAVSLPHLLGGEREREREREKEKEREREREEGSTLLVASGSLLACLGLFGIGMGDESSISRNSGCSSKVENSQKLVKIVRIFISS